MEIPEQDLVLLQPVRPTQRIGLKTAGGSDPEKERQVGSEAESIQRMLEPMNAPPSQAFIEFRIRQLYNRRLLLLNTQHFRKKTEDNSGGTTEETSDAGENSDEPCELEVIQKELEELMAQKEEEKERKSAKLSNGQQDVLPTLHKTETPHGGIYLLPPVLPIQEDVALERRIKTRFSSVRPTGPVVTAHRLGQNPAFTQCPSCRHVVFTKTHSKVGEAAWILCCMCSTMGCVAGCCLIPFFMDHLKDTHHHCPQCQAHIHTNVRF